MNKFVFIISVIILVEEGLFSAIVPGPEAQLLSAHEEGSLHNGTEQPFLNL